MKRNESTAFDPETIELMRSVLELAWGSLGPEQQVHMSRSLLAQRILNAAAQGERDPTRLRVRALVGIVSFGLKAG
jgi:hypothetical protein